MFCSREAVSRATLREAFNEAFREVMIMMREVIRGSPSTHLHAVAMMNIPIDDEDSGDPEAAARDGDGHAHIVEQAESHRLRRFAMVPWRTHHGEPIPQLAVHHSRDHLDDGACREARRVPGGACGEVGVAVEAECRARRAVARVQPCRLGHLLGRVHELEVSCACLSRRYQARARVEPAFDELIVDGDEACGALWMWRVALVQQHRPHARE